MGVESLSQFGDMLLVHQILDQFVARHVLPVHQVFHALLPREQYLHFAQAVLHVVLVVRLVAFGRGVGWLAHGGSRRGPPL
jgi:hypothetical protein